jgi:aarF domain-containing kinase
LNNEFRLNYSQFWLSILHADQEGIKEYADKLGVGQLYGLFACMVAGRSWSSITKGIDKAEKTASEVWKYSNRGSSYFWARASI